MSNIQDLDLKRLLSKCVKEAEDAGVFNPDSAMFRSLRERVKSNEDECKEIVQLIMTFLSFNSSITRLCTMQHADYFYMRSKLFRRQFNEKLFEVLLFTAEIDALHHPLPTPKEDADKLKLFTMGSFKRWYEAFGEENVALQSAITKLKTARTLDYERASSEMTAERRRREEEEEKKTRKAQAVAAKVRSSFLVHETEMDRTLAEARSLLRILVPSFVDVENGDADSEQQSGPVDPKVHGYSIGESFTISIPSTAPTVEVNELNEDVVRSAIDAKKLLESHLKKTDKWLKQVGGHSSGKLLRDILTMKKAMQVERDKISELGLVVPTKKKKIVVKRKEEGDSSDDEDSDFEDVPEKELEDFCPPEDVPVHILDAIGKREREENKKREGEEWDNKQPGCSNWSNDDPSSDCLPSTSSSSPQKIPKIAFGLDLMYWGEKRKDATQVPMNNADCHRFWRPPDDGDTRTERKEVYEQRVYTFVGEEMRAERACRVPLKNGGICPRMDIHKCPIHGKIVARDEEGFPVEELKRDEKEEEEERKRREEAERREDEEFQRDLESGLGRSLDGNGRGRKKKKKKEEKRPASDGRSVRERLQTKLLDPKAIKRVSAVLEEVRRAKIRKKFGDQTAHRNL